MRWVETQHRSGLLSLAVNFACHTRPLIENEASQSSIVCKPTCSQFRKEHHSTSEKVPCGGANWWSFCSVLLVPGRCYERKVCSAVHSTGHLFHTSVLRVKSVFYDNVITFEANNTNVLIILNEFEY